MSISSLRGHFLLFLRGKGPCWLFSGTYLDALTGATFDVYVSLLGKVFKTTPKPPPKQNEVHPDNGAEVHEGRRL